MQKEQFFVLLLNNTKGLFDILKQNLIQGPFHSYKDIWAIKIYK